MSLLDGATGGVPFRDLTPDQLSKAMEALAQGRAASTVHTYAASIRAFFTWLHDDELPPKIRKALKRHGSIALPTEQVISPAEFRALLANVDETTDREFVLQFQALLWVLWDAGLRISEALSLRVGDVQVADDLGMRLALPRDAPNLKTGPRTVYVVECVAALKAWLAAHPQRNNPKAPLFPSARDPASAMPKQSVVKYLWRLAKRTLTRYLHPHLFRHTRATRAAEDGWNEAQLCAYFGWKPGSRMAAHYVHLSQVNVEKRVRQDAKADPLGAMMREDPRRALADTISATIAALAQQGHLGGAPRPAAGATPA